jgi:hypothetical protein
MDIERSLFLIISLALSLARARACALSPPKPGGCQKQQHTCWSTALQDSGETRKFDRLPPTQLVPPGTTHIS